MSLRTTQIGKEVWASDPGNNRLTQIGKEVWENTTNLTNNRLTQIGKEVWEETHNTSFVRVTQIGKEVWCTTANLTVQLDAQYREDVFLTTGSAVQLDTQSLETAFHNQGVIQQDASYLEIIFNYDATIPSAIAISGIFTGTGNLSADAFVVHPVVVRPVVQDLIINGWFVDHRGSMQFYYRTPDCLPGPRPTEY